MATRVVEGKKPYTGGKAIEIDENKVISLRLRDENNLIIWDEGDNEIYVDLQLDDEITPTSAFPVGITTGRVIVDNGWDEPGTIICAKTTSGDNIKLLYADSGNLYIDNGTGTFKQIYLKADVDALLLALRSYIDDELAKKQNGVVSDTAPENPSEGDLWYNTTNDSMKVWDGSQWSTIGGGISNSTEGTTSTASNIRVGTTTEYGLITPAEGQISIVYTDSTPPTPTPPFTPGANTIFYYPLISDFIDASGNSSDIVPHDSSVSTIGLYNGVNCFSLNGDYSTITNLSSNLNNESNYTYSLRLYLTDNVFCAMFSENGSRGASGMQNLSDRTEIRWGNPTNMITTYMSTSILPKNAWFHYAITLNNGKACYYINGVETVIQNSGIIAPNHNKAPFVINASPNLTEFIGTGYLSDLILENKGWTAQEVSDYFDLTKATYGIS